jgi:hypothetical protein
MRYQYLYRYLTYSRTSEDLSIISASDPALHVLQYGEPEPQLGAGHPGYGQLPPDRLPHQGLRHLCQREVGVITVQFLFFLPVLCAFKV